MDYVTHRPRAPMVPERLKQTHVPDGVSTVRPQGETTALARPSQPKGLSLQDEQKGAGSFTLREIPIGLPSVLRRRNFETTELLKAYATNELVWAAINIKAQASKDPRLVVETRSKTDDAWEEESGHGFRRLWMRPNPAMDEAEFLRAMIVSRDTAGKFYAEKIYSRAGKLVELWPIDPSKIKPVYQKNRDGSETLDHYLYKDGQYKQKYDPDDLLIWQDWRIGPQSPLAVAYGATEADSLQTEYVQAFFKNAGIPSGVLHVLNRSLNEQQSDKIRANWRAKYSRQWGNQHDVAVLDENAEYQKIGANLDELASDIIRSITESRIAMVFGVPPLIIYAYVGLMRSTYSNLDEAWAQFWKTTMSALLRDARTFLMWSLLPEFVDEEDIYAELIRLNWDMSQVVALQEDVDAIHSRARNDFKAGLLTLNEARSRIGEGDWPDVQIGESNPFLGVGERNPYLEQVVAALVSSVSTQPADNEPDDEPADEDDEDGEPDDETAAGVPVETKGRDEILDGYEDELTSLTQAAIEGDIGRDNFEAEAVSLIDETFTELFLLGASAGDVGDLTTEARLLLDTELEEHRDFVAGLADDIFAGTYEGNGTATVAVDIETKLPSILKRIKKWVNKARGIYETAKLHDKSDPVYEWRRGNTADPCKDCLSLDGLRMKASSWRKFTFRPRGRTLACKGYNCQCVFVKVSD